MSNSNFDVIIIGGSYAGLSAAMSLGRSLRHVLVIDSGKPCNQQTPHAHNLLTHDGDQPATIVQVAREELLEYSTISLVHDEAISGCKSMDGFQINTKSGNQYAATKIILATGIKDLMPALPGFKECWGISVVHCPYCHGYESKSKKTAIMANSDKAFHLVSLVYNLTKDLAVLTNGMQQFTEEQLAKLDAYGIQIYDAEVTEIEHKAGQVKQVHLADGTSLPFETVYAALPFTQHSEIAMTLGCELTSNGHISINHSLQTSVKGVYACGDCAAMMRSLANAISMGNLAGAMINRELVDESF
jgi:thioredoxin reductase